MQITIYTQSNCHYCDATKTLLDWHDINYKEFDVTDIPKHPDKHAELFEKSPLPHVFINDKHIGSYQQLVEFISQGKHRAEF